ncbi:MAG TPA: hypothetical protein VHY10_05860 [Xanthobacteraceae bacterium]|jgi:hypothetical protein|nr:hypothetical protein [Xanthobacteraceae bacterium]
MLRSLSYFTGEVARPASGSGRQRVASVIAAAALAFALAACSKCDVPNLLPHQAGPQSCHSGPDPQ